MKHELAPLTRTIGRASAMALGVAALAFGANACMIGHHHDDVVIVNDEAYFADIDTDEVLTTSLGEGAGLFVEYEGGGKWTLWTSCDTSISHRGCAFDAYVTAGSDIDHIVAINFETSDGLDIVGNSLTFHSDTDYDSDAVTFYTYPGADLELDVLLDGYTEPSFIFWHGNGYVHEGAPYSPVVFTPTLP